MEKNKEDVLERNLEQKHFEDAARAIKSGKKSGDLTNVELVENLVESYKGKTVEAPIEVIMTSALFLNARELMGTMDVLKRTLHVKMVEELERKLDKGEEVTEEDVKTAFFLVATMKEEFKK